MSLVHVFKLLLRNWKQLLLIPLALAAAIYYFTRNETKEYASETMIYTGIASGYSLNGSKTPDFFATSNAFDNLLTIINARETKQEVGIQLLAEHLLLESHDPSKLGWSAYEKVQQLFPQAIRANLVKADLPLTIAAIDAYATQNDTNSVYRLLNSDAPYYSIEALQRIESMRISSSDLVKVSYKCDDAAICKRTLEIMVETFIKKNRIIRTNQTESVIAYFEEQLRSAYQRLDRAELSFLDFNISNDIINYYEQTKAVAGERENLYTQNHFLEMDEKASETGLDVINRSIEGRIYQTLYGQEINDYRQQLASTYNQIAFGEMLRSSQPDAVLPNLDSLRLVAGGLEKNIKSAVEKLYVKSTTPNGIPNKNILDEWIKATLAYEQSRARLTVMDKRKKEFQEEYRKFAPLGAMLKKIERQISVSEKEYLELLHGLNLARLMQQNNELTSRLTIVDRPFFPTKAGASKRKLLAAVGFVAGFMIVVASILLNFLINQTLQHPGRATKIIGIPLLGVYPLLHERNAFLDKANRRLLQQLIPQLDFGAKPLQVGLFSIQPQEGKSTLRAVWAEQLRSLGYRVAEHQWSEFTTLSPDPDVELTLIEFPALEVLVLVPGHIPQLQKAILVARANRVWTTLDRNLLNIFSKMTATQPVLALNGVEADFAEEHVGEVPKRRDLLRATIKRLLKFEFGNRRGLTRRRKKR